MDTTSVETVLKSIRDACGRERISLVDGVVANADRAPSIAMVGGSFLDALIAEKPAALFMSSMNFDLDDVIEMDLLEQGWEDETDDDEDEKVYPDFEEVKEFLRPQWEPIADKQGEPCFLEFVYVKDGMIRICRYRAPWYIDFEPVIKLYLEAHELGDASEYVAQRAANSLVIDGLIEEISRSEQFQKTRGAPKRRLLVRSQYGERIPFDPEDEPSKATGDRYDRNFEHVMREASDKAWLLEHAPKA